MDSSEGVEEGRRGRKKYEILINERVISQCLGRKVGNIRLSRATSDVLHFENKNPLANRCLKFVQTCIKRI